VNIGKYAGYPISFRLWTWYVVSLYYCFITYLDNSQCRMKFYDVYFSLPFDTTEMSRRQQRFHTLTNGFVNFQ
jgi:hypothetical protein